MASPNPPIRAAASESFRTDGAGEKLAPLGAYVLNLAQLVESANINIGAIASQEALSDRDYITLEYPDIQLTFATSAPLSLSIQLSLEFPLCWLPVYRCLSFCAQDHFDPLLPLVEQLVARNTAEPPLLNPCSLYALRSHVYRLLDRLDEAFLDAMRIVWLHPEDPAGYCLRGLIFLQGGLPDLANANLEAALAHAPSSRYLAFIRDRALQFQSNEPLLHLVAEAEAAVMKGDYQSAIQRYDGLFEDHPKLAQYYYDRAYCYFRLRQWESGLRDVRKALELYIFWPAKKINRSGYLLKRGKRNRSFKRRYVIVRHAFLFYYISDQHDIPQGFIPLIYCTIVPGSFKSCSFDIKETEGDR
ncbi:MAG TPA: hypothetical protein VJB16_02925, partial [archaeon]|nr:hypothetical protein [archaeon]